MIIISTWQVWVSSPSSLQGSPRPGGESKVQSPRSKVQCPPHPGHLPIRWGEGEACSVRLLSLPVIKQNPSLLFLAAMILSPLPMALGASTNTTWQAVGISEFMATNRTTVLDLDGDPSGWIEIFNP